MMNDAIRRPEWQGCPSFNQAWSGVAQMVSDPRLTNVEVDAALALARSLASARVVVVDQSELDAWQEAVDEHGLLMNEDQTPQLPFDELFLEVRNPRKEYGIRAVHFDGEIATPFTVGADGEWILPLFAGRMAGGDCALLLTASHFARYLRTRPTHERMDLHHVASDALGMVGALAFVLRSANVELDGEPVSRQQRRSAERDNREIPLTVKVRFGHRKSIARGGKANYSHAFEVRAHPQFHTAGVVFEQWSRTKPQKVFDHPATGVPCVQVWHPGAVKGSGVFVPKIREVAA